MGTATAFAPQSLAAPRASGLVQRVLAAVADWLPTPARNEDMDNLSNEIRHDIGLPPRNLRMRPYSDWPA